MESMKRANRFLSLDMKQSIVWFWGVMLLLNSISYTVTKVYGITYFGISESNSANVVAANLMPIIIYFIAYSYEMYYQSFPVALAFSITRKDFYKSLIIRNVFTAFIFALIQSILMKLDIFIINALGINPIVEFEIFNTSSDNIIYIMLSLFVAFIAFTSISNLLGALNYRFGFKLWIAIGLVFSLSIAFAGPSVWKLFNELFTTRIDTLQLVILGVIMIVCYSIGYIIVTNTNIKNKVS